MWELNSSSIISQYYLKTQITSSAERPSTSGAEKPSTSSAEKPSTSSTEKSRIHVGAALLNVAKALSPLKTRKSRKCTSCMEYRESLKEKSEKNLRLQREKQQLIKQAAAKERVRKAKVVNQTVKRKEATIKNITERIADSEAEQELEIAKKNLSASEKRHRELKKYHKDSKQTARKRLSLEYEATKSELIEKIREKEETIVELENEKMELEEKVKEMESEKKDTKLDGKSYSPDMKMMVRIFCFPCHCFQAFNIHVTLCFNTSCIFKSTGIL